MRHPFSEGAGIFDATPYGSANEVLAALPVAPPDCVVLDQQMPGMTGLELLLHLHQEGLRIPTVVITAPNDAEMRERYVTAGASSYLKAIAGHGAVCSD